MNIPKILDDSFRLLLSQPKVFIPRFITTALYSVVTLYSVFLMADVRADISDVMDPQAAAQYLGRTLFLFASMPLLYIVDIISYAMYPRIVADHEARRPINLTSALKDSLKAWKVVIVLGLVIFALMGIIMVAISASMYMTYVTGTPAFTVAAAVFALGLVLAFSVVMFFVVPASILDGRGVVDSFRQSMRMGIAHGKDLMKMNLMFMGLLLTTLLFAFFSDSGSVLSAASLAVFLVLRLLEAVLYTYISVTNPMAYLHVRVNNPRKK
jgi:hypothetical protein